MTEYHLDRPGLATTYDELSDSQFTKGSELVDTLEIGPKHVVLDIGAGTSRLGRKVLGRQGTMPPTSPGPEWNQQNATEPMGVPACKRIAVVGVTCSGKSTLADRLSRSLGLVRIELDALYWKPGWVGTNLDEFRAKVDTATRGPLWVVDGNYASVRDLVWGRADLIVWLDYPLRLVLARYARRTWRRWRSKELLWGTNMESLRQELMLWSKRSLIHWLFRSYFRHRREYPAELAGPARGPAASRRFKYPHEVEAWLEGLK